MSIFFRPVTRGLLLSSFLILAACDSAEERAEGHFQNGLQLLEAGDVDRALVEFKNVFDLNANHREARLTYARLMRESGNIRQAYGHYLRVAEQFPDDAETRLTLTEIAILQSDWAETKRHAERAIQLSPDTPRGKVIETVLAYHKAVEAKDPSARRSAADRIGMLVAQLDDRTIARQLTIDNFVRDREFTRALEEIDIAISEGSGDTRNLNRLKLSILNQIGDEDGFQEHLESLVKIYPDDDTYSQSLIRWYTSRGNIDAAEAFLREEVATAGDSVAERVNLVAFLQRTRGRDAAKAELNQYIDAGLSPDLFRSLRAGITFDEGDRDGAIAEMESIVDAAEQSEQTRDIKINLARMLLAVENQVAARQRVEEVLAEDRGHVEALKMRAAWLIEDDKADEAIVNLRNALDQAPQDPQIMSLMAQAHIRNGSRSLAGEMLSLAAEASNNAPAESLAYARFLIVQDNDATAEAVLVDALRADPGNPAILNVLGSLYVRTQDWARAEQVESTLRRQNDNEATRIADALRVTRLRAQQRGDEAITFLEELATRDGDDGLAEIAVIRAHFASGNYAAAEGYIDAALREDPDRRLMRYMKAALFAATDRNDQAVELYRALLAEDPNDEVVWRALYLSHLREGELDTARAVLSDALQSVPDSANLLWALAGEQERAGNIASAIEIYERLYDRNPNAPVIANNLASLIASYDDSPEQINRAFAIARRLRGVNVPAFQDTYGWIAFRRGDLPEAIDHLEPAAAGLPGDPLVQYHLAAAYAALERYKDSLRQYRVALDVAGPADTRPQFETARQEIQRIESLLAETEGN